MDQLDEWFGLGVIVILVCAWLLLVLVISPWVFPRRKKTDAQTDSNQKQAP